ncbi:MAG: 1-(5-phosphoribosyl)-5-[(5-phosphoribosylamino)methylideneamino]imidazole-4-carboxamide isomerase [Planctomycetaceae bacterium]|jgi:phosphoribosylformimino-5-aminoimidazole carboxamide ribotide isomerase|nr:1-(5-phosphoribosyl)-5-[(5-phosphoribosylamino)methylideneamino]imidazole-4-carboxamide isomerase [Planctomycetaceae bacterium]
MKLLPAIDILNAKCVRLRQGDYNNETVYANNPAEVARFWVSCGAEMLHVVDLDGAKVGGAANKDSVIEIVKAAGIPVEIGGGIRDEATIQYYLDKGVNRIVIGTLALKQPDWFREMSAKFPFKLVLGIDARNGFVATEGWLETSKTSAVKLAQQFANLKLAAIVYTDIAKDGTLEGPNFNEMLAMHNAVSFQVVASGGIAAVEDLVKLKELGIDACIIGKALYEKKFTLQEAVAALSFKA